MKITFLILIVSFMATANASTVSGWCSNSCMTKDGFNSCPSGVFGHRNPSDGLKDCARNDAIQACLNSSGRPGDDARSTSPECSVVRSDLLTTRYCISYGSVSCAY